MQNYDKNINLLKQILNKMVKMYSQIQMTNDNVKDGKTDIWTANVQIARVWE